MNRKKSGNLPAVISGILCDLKNHGKKVYILSLKDDISHELKTGGDGYFDLKDIGEIWGKDLKYREKE